MAPVPSSSNLSPRSFPQGGALSLSTLIQHLSEKDTACNAAKTIAGMADLLAQIVAAGALPPLVALLGAQSTAAMQQEAAKALGYLAVNSDNLFYVQPR